MTPTCESSEASSGSRASPKSSTFTFHGAALASSHRPVAFAAEMATHASKPSTIDPRDYLAIDALLDDEERAIRDTVRQWVRERILPEVGEWFEQGILPRELAQEVGQLGLFGMHLDGYGLPGASAVAYGLTTFASCCCTAGGGAAF